MGIKMINSLKYTVLVALLVLGGTTMSLASAQDYQFEILGQPIKAAHDATIVVQVTQVSTHKPLTNPNITNQMLHMIMGTMDEPAKLHPLTPDEKGNVRFSADLTMYGEWTLDLSASVPSEKDPVKASLKFQVVK